MGEDDMRRRERNQRIVKTESQLFMGIVDFGGDLSVAQGNGCSCPLLQQLAQKGVVSQAATCESGDKCIQSGLNMARAFVGKPSIQVGPNLQPHDEWMQ